MNFISISFLVLMIAVLLCLQIIHYTCKESYKYSNIVLFICSCIFCGWQSWRFCLIVLIEGVVIYFIALLMENSLLKRKVWLFIGVLVEIIVLAIFKYYNFFADTFNYFGISLKRMEILLPLGISYYTFSAIGYLVDVYKGKYLAQKDVVQMLLFMSFFPKLTAGPIISAESFFKQSGKNRIISLYDVSVGIQIVLLGIIKKNVFADHIAEFTHSVFDNVSMYNARTLVLVIFVYGIQLYLDFSGYSDIAIGISKCLGFEMPCNFNLPYLSRNVSEFWKRWHISLSNWLMEYIYIPLGGNRKGFFRSCINLLITMIIGGIWHGASWNFVCWGAWCGALLVMHKIYIHVCNIPKTYIPAIPKFITGVLVTYIANIFGFFILGVPNWKVFVLVMKRVILGKTGVSFYSTWAIAGTIFVFLEIVISIVKELKNSKYEYKYAYVNIFYPMFNLNRFKDLVIFFVIAGLAFGLIYTNSSPFMYAAF